MLSAAEKKEILTTFEIELEGVMQAIERLYSGREHDHHAKFIENIKNTWKNYLRSELKKTSSAKK